MKKLNTYISYFLLLAFAWVILPTHTIHDIFANHHDTADNFCKLYHSHLGTHVEEQHTHCDILNVNTPVYHAPQLVIVGEAPFIFKTISFRGHFGKPMPTHSCYIPARAPPVVA